MKIFKERMETKGDYEAKNEFLDNSIRNSMGYFSHKVNLYSIREKEKYNLRSR